MKNVKLSIIVPVFNVEKYIEKCLSSIFSQEVDESLFEVVIVNDGTKDNSMNIVKSIVAKHNNIKLIVQKNQGLSVARNNGLKAAKGEYVWFVDSDDTINGRIFSEFCDSQKSYKWDVIGFNMEKIYEKDYHKVIDRIVYHKKYTFLLNKEVRPNDFPGKVKITPTQRFIYKRNFLLINHLEFLRGIFHEDIDFFVRILCCSPAIYIVNKANYNYLIRENGSITSSFKMKRILDLRKIIDHLQMFGEENNISKNKWRIINAYIFDVALAIYSNGDFSNKEYTSFVKKNRKSFCSIIITSFIKSLKYNTFTRTAKLILVLLSPKIINKIG